MQAIHQRPNGPQFWFLTGYPLRTPLLWMVALEVSLAGCVGTDFITRPVSTMPARVLLTPATKALQVGTTASLQATYYDSLGNPVATTFQWTSSAPSVASVDTSGLVVGHQPGQAQIMAMAHGVSSSPAIVTVVADPNQVARVTVTPDSGQINVGDSLQFVVAAFNLSGSTLSGQAYSWRSTNTSVATVDPTGKVTALTAGSAGIIAATSGVESTPAFLYVFGRSRSGAFIRNPGQSHDVRGTATLQEQAGGSLVLSFGSDFSTSSGPGVTVFLSSSNVVTSGSLNLGLVKQYSGAQSYAIPAGVQLTTYSWVIVHCVPVNVTFGYAPLQ